MENKALKTRFTLPPNVNGRCRGRLSLCLHEIKWYSEEPFQFNWIQAKLIWWGDKYQSGVTLRLKSKKQLKKSFGHVIHYNILTKLNLFKNYLQSSESVDIKFSSGISNIDIGLASIPIPKELIAFIDKQSIQNTKKVGKFHKKGFIFNTNNKKMGEVLIDYDLVLYDRVMDEAEMNKEISREMNKEMMSNNFIDSVTINGIENDMNQSNLKSELWQSSTKKDHKKHSKIKLSQIDRNTNKSLDKLSTLSSTSLSSSNPKSQMTLLNYLRGRPLERFEENEAVKAMESTSPTESLIDLLSFDLNGLYIPKKTNDDETKILQKIDCIRVHVYDLCLTRAGTREILSNHAFNENSFSSGTFSIDVDMDTVLTTKSRFENSIGFMSKVTRIFSSSIEAVPPSIEFNRSAIYKLNAFCIKNQNSFANGTISLIIRYRDIESSESRTLGTVRFQLGDIIQATNLTFHQPCPVKTATSEIIIGRLSLKAELGCRGLHFGADFLDAISSNNTHESEHDNRYYPRYTDYIDYRQSHECCRYPHKRDDLFYEQCIYDIHDEQTDNKSETPSTPINIESKSSNSQKVYGRNEEKDFQDLPDKELNLQLNKPDELNDDNENELKGLFHVGLINYCSWFQSASDTYLVCRPFWSESILGTENCQNETKEENYQLNYLELFSVICDQSFVETTKHGFMSIEVWQSKSNPTVQASVHTLVGSAKVPLHQFFIAFNNAKIRSHVSQQELPVISIDGWVTILSDNKPLGTVQTVLAVGTTAQINNFKKSKNLQFSNKFLRMLNEFYPAQTSQSFSNAVQSNDKRKKDSAKSALLQMSSDPNSNLASIFSNFIDNLASRLPERHSTTSDTATTATQINSKCNNSVAVKQNNKHLRPTSELLDELQKALAIAPSPAQRIAIPHTAVPRSQPTPELSIDTNTPKPIMFPIHIEIESALHLPSISIHVNKKSGKRNRNTVNSAKKTGNSTEIQPSTYATFEASASLNAANLMSYTTNIVENSCSPQWNKHFEVYMPVDFLLNDEKRFLLQVWRKINDNAPKTRLIPNSSNDVKIGIVSVDLSVLMAGLPSISGWFNIIDHSGCINGQIKIHIKPKDDVTIYQKRSIAESKAPIIDNEATGRSQNTDEIPVDLKASENRAIDDSALSRALKRKFTELEEITQRLRARLFDVTGNMSIDPDDQFEEDLNTIPDEDDDFEESNIASEMSLDWLEHCQNQASSNDSTERTDNFESSIAAQMRDIFDFISPDLDANQSTPAIPTDGKQTEPLNFEMLNQHLNDRFSTVLNAENTHNDGTDQAERSVQKIAESLEKSIIDD